MDTIDKLSELLREYRDDLKDLKNEHGKDFDYSINGSYDDAYEYGRELGECLGKIRVITAAITKIKSS